MSLTLHCHPLSSYCHKVLVALYELALPFEARLLDLGNPTERDAFLQLWPTGKMPLLVDDGQVVPETSIIIEHLQARHAPGAGLLPAEPRAQLEARLWDRLFDLYVMTPMQAIVAQHLRPEADRDAKAIVDALATLAMAYGMIERHLADGREWAAGAAFGIADCAAAPALFYAHTITPFAASHPRLGAYFERLVARPSVARVLREARPWLAYYPLRDQVPARFLGEA